MLAMNPTSAPSFATMNDATLPTLPPQRRNIPVDKASWWNLDDPNASTRDFGARRLVTSCMQRYKWSEEFTIRILQGYCQFMDLKVACDDQSIQELIPPILIDLMWQEHILDIANYVQDSDLLWEGKLMVRDDRLFHDPLRAVTTKIALKARFGKNLVDSEVWSYQMMDGKPDDDDEQEGDMNRVPASQASMAVSQGTQTSAAPSRAATPASMASPVPVAQASRAPTPQSVVSAASRASTPLPSKSPTPVPTTPGAASSAQASRANTPLPPKSPGALPPATPVPTHSAQASRAATPLVPKSTATFVQDFVSPAPSVHFSMSPAPSVHAPVSPAPSIRAPMSPAASVYTPRSPASRVATSPAPSVHTTASAAPSTRTAASPAPSVHTSVSAAPSVHAPMSPAPSVHTTASVAQSTRAPMSPAPSVHTTALAAPSIRAPMSPAPSVHFDTATMRRDDASLHSHAAHSVHSLGAGSVAPSVRTSANEDASVHSHAVSVARSVHYAPAGDDRSVQSHRSQGATSVAHSIHAPANDELSVHSHRSHGGASVARSVHAPANDELSVHSHRSHGGASVARSVHAPANDEASVHSHAASVARSVHYAPAEDNRSVHSHAASITHSVHTAVNDDASVHSHAVSVARSVHSQAAPSVAHSVHAPANDELSVHSHTVRSVTHSVGVPDNMSVHSHGAASVPQPIVAPAEIEIQAPVAMVPAANAALQTVGAHDTTVDTYGSFEVQVSGRMELDISALEDDTTTMVEPVQTPVSVLPAIEETGVATATGSDDSTVPAATEPHASDKSEARSRAGADDASASVGSQSTATGKARLFVVISRKSLDHTVVANQLYMFTVLGAKRIPYEVLDASDPDTAPLRDQLFALSGSQDRFPQFFAKAIDGTITYWGGWDRFVDANEKGKLSKEFRAANISLKA